MAKRTLSRSSAFACCPCHRDAEQEAQPVERPRRTAPRKKKVPRPPGRKRDDHGDDQRQPVVGLSPIRAEKPSSREVACMFDSVAKLLQDVGAQGEIARLAWRPAEGNSPIPPRPDSLRQAEAQRCQEYLTDSRVPRHGDPIRKRPTASDRLTSCKDHASGSDSAALSSAVALSRPRQAATCAVSSVSLSGSSRAATRPTPLPPPSVALLRVGSGRHLRPPGRSPTSPPPPGSASFARRNIHRMPAFV